MTQKCPVIDLKVALATVEDRPATPMTLAELIDTWAARTMDRNAIALRRWRDDLGDIPAWNLSTEQITAVGDALLGAGYKPAYVNRQISALGTAYKWAIRQRLTPRGFRSPTLGVQRHTEAPRRVEVAREDIERLLTGAKGFRDQRFHVLLHILLDSGARKSEVLERRWRDFDLEAGTITAPMTKNGTPRVLHIRPSTVARIKRVWKRRDADTLPFEGRIPNTPVSYKKSWEILTRDVGLPDLHLHDLRHVAAADLLRSGVTLGVAAQVLGHGVKMLAQRYGHLETGALRAAQELRWAAV